MQNSWRPRRSSPWLAAVPGAGRGVHAEPERLRGEGATAFFVAVDGRPAGVVAAADPVKGTTPAALAGLAEEDVRVVMLTGDNRTTAEAVAKRLGIAELVAEVLPEDKQRVVERLKAEGRRVAMAGDGVNDAPALAAADVGIAMGTGADVAIESAGVTLLGGDLTGILRARRLPRAAMRNIRQNLFFAFAYNAAAVPVAAGVRRRGDGRRRLVEGGMPEAVAGSRPVASTWGCTAGGCAPRSSMMSHLAAGFALIALSTGVSVTAAVCLGLVS